jgi:aspartate oxidase
MAQVQERRPASNWAPGSAPRPPDPPSFVARLIAACALARRESRGAHYRLDFPQKDEAFHRHSVVSRGAAVRFE